MDINNMVQQLILFAPPFLFAITCHELAHGYVAYRLGDPTAKNEGRLTLNPIKHIDPWGALAFILIRFGWAKPVPVNPSYFRDPQKGMLLVALAGPGANILLALASATLFKLLQFFPAAPSFIAQPLGIMLGWSVIINIMLAVFNCLPIPPLDGSKALMGILPIQAARKFAELERYGMIILLLLLVTNIIPRLIWPIIIDSSNFLLPEQVVYYILFS
jgi:Zn-dependent protease